MPKELETLFINTLNLDVEKAARAVPPRQQVLRDKLKNLTTE
jgi:hypothetical protein